jgi:hypothetical protein
MLAAMIAVPVVRREVCQNNGYPKTAGNNRCQPSGSVDGRREQCRQGQAQNRCPNDGLQRDLDRIDAVTDMA